MYYVFDSENVGLFVVEEETQQKAIAIAHNEVSGNATLIEGYARLSDLDMVYGEELDVW